jgi:hypothetical protein
MKGTVLGETEPTRLYFGTVRALQTTKLTMRW